MLMRFRRYRVFLIVAVLLTILLLRLSNRKDWPQYPQTAVLDIVSPNRKEQPAKAQQVEGLPRKPQWTARPLQAETPAGEPKSVKSVVALSTSAPTVHEATTSRIINAIPKTTAPTAPKIDVPDRTRPVPGSGSYREYDLEHDDIHPVAPPGRQELNELPAASVTIHWQKQVEHFPVPTESIIKLPTGAPVSIPRIQHAFKDETADAKRTREKRQMAVKDEFRKAWGGYKKNAWMHDELSPASGKFRDPFCGWAATLVDALDTLWIMGLEEEFEKAVEAVDLIDFTTSPRSDIPVFETTIRYLGGLLAAYDVSGAKHPSLLNKAVELADILMGAFDTPNRMPVLFYRWKPAFASQAHRASQRSNLAELGSLSLEFTRLAQLTHDTRYYDAIARITNALEEWQKRGTSLGSVFPEQVDASGCNRTEELTTQQPIAPELIVPSAEEEKVLGYVPSSPDTKAEPRKKGVKSSPSGPGTLQVQMIAGDPGTAKAEISEWKDEKGKTKRDADPPKNPVSGLPTRTRPNNAEVIAAQMEKLSTDSTSWDCTPQGLEPADTIYASMKFGMGGGQDSTYEYFPKQYLLLGGQITQYREMYRKTVDDIKKWMLYRPMIPEDDRAILFSGAVTTEGNPKKDSVLIPETTHLTCFIGGMIGMGAKIFGLEGDLEIAERLSDGCVWAYESTPHGIMPELALLVPCKSVEHCPWNETLYYQELDPIWASRDQTVADYIEQKKKVDAELEERKKAAALKKEAEKLNLQTTEDEDDLAARIPHPNANSSAELKKDEPASLQKRQNSSSPKFEVPKPITHNFKEQVAETKAIEEAKSRDPVVELTPQQKFYEQKTNSVESDLEIVGSNGWADEHPTTQTKEIAPVMRDPSLPFTHKEFVETRIKQEMLPPGFTSIRSRKYILRPEAIESVWYMYRITGSTIWQEKGWNMFTSIINATSTAHGHSAIFDVTAHRNETFKMDEMESFWLAETLKYFYLLYSTPDVVSLDDWVLNTEAHPFRRPDAGTV